MSETRNRDGLDGSSNERSFAVPTLVVAIIGAVTGIVGMALGVFGCWEERKIDLTVRATVDGYAGADPMQVRVAIANGGVRGVVIESASVERDKRQLGETLGYVRADVDAGVFPFPISLAAREGREILVGVQVTSTFLPASERPHPVLKALVDTAERLPSGAPIPALELVLDTEPGGVQRYPIRTGPRYGTGSLVEFEGIFEDRHLTGIIVSRVFDFPRREPQLARLDLYPTNGDPTVRIRRPLTDRVEFATGRLPLGVYDYALRGGKRLIDVGKLIATCTDRCELDEVAGGSW